MDTGYIGVILIPFIVIFGIIPVLPLECILGLLHTLLTAIMLFCHLGVVRITFQQVLSTIVTAYTVILMVVFPCGTYPQEVIQVFGVYIYRISMQVAECGLITVVLVIFVPWTSILIGIAIKVQVCGVKVV